MKIFSFAAALFFFCNTFNGFTTAQELNNLKIGGRMLNDWVWMSPGDNVKQAVGDFTNGTDFRQIWFNTTGSIYDNMDFIVQLDFSGGAVKLKNVYVTYTGLPVTLRAGHIRQPFSLESITSVRFLTFMERALPNLFSPGWNNGVQVFSDVFESRLNWAAGVFANTANDGYGSTEEGYNISGRVFGMPYYEGNGAKLLHFGFSITRMITDGAASYDQTPEINLAPEMVDTGTFACESMMLYNGESALVYGPYSVQAEVFSTRVSNDTLDNPAFFSYYAQASWFLTGEHRVYKSGSFTNVIPLRSVGTGGYGAVEAAARYSYLDLDSGAIAGGQLRNMTLGINWYLNANSRIMVNYIRADLVDVGNVNMLGTRMQVLY